MSKKPKEIKPIERYIIAGLCKVITDYWGLPSTVKVSTRDDVYDAFVQAHEKKPVFPYAYLKVTTGGITPASYRPDVTSRQGVLSRISNVSSQEQKTIKAHMMSFVPYTFGFVLSYVTDDFESVLDCVSRQSYASIANKLNFNLSYCDVNHLINVKVDSEASFPQKSRLGNDVSAFQVDIQLTVEGFISSPDREDDYQVPLIKDVNLEIQMGEHI